MNQDCDDLDSAICWTILIAFAVILASTINKVYNGEVERYDTAEHHP